MPQADPPPFARALRAELDRKGWSASELASRAGISRQYAHYLLAGAKGPSLEVARRIAEALGVSLDVLAGRE